MDPWTFLHIRQQQHRALYRHPLDLYHQCFAEVAYINSPSRQLVILINLGCSARWSPDSDVSLIILCRVAQVW